MRNLSFVKIGDISFANGNNKLMRANHYFINMPFIKSPVENELDF